MSDTLCREFSPPLPISHGVTSVREGGSKGRREYFNFPRRCSPVVTYSVRVNGKDVTTHSYERNFTRAINIWANKNDTTHGLGKEGLEWVESTASEFAKDASRDAKLADLEHEYDFYFGAQAKN
jgi:hypothetical protein